MSENEIVVESEEQESCVQIGEPRNTIKVLENEIKKPESEIKEPDIEIHEHKSVKPESNIENIENVIKEPESDIKDPENVIQDPQIDINEPVNENQASENDIKEPKSEIQEPESEIQEPQIEIKEPEIEIKEPEIDVNVPENVIKELENENKEDAETVEKSQDDLNENMALSVPTKHEHLYKILVIGELGTGKTSFIKRYVHQFFSKSYRATIGVDFALKVLNWDDSTIIRLQLWDIAGQERFGNMTRVYYKEAVGAFIVFDLTRAATFDAVVKWKQDLDSKVQLADRSPIPCILLANKCDQPKQGIANNPNKMDEYCKEHGFSGWFETSAKENINIDEAARALVSKILVNDRLYNAGEILDSERFSLENQKPAQEDTKKCAC